MRGRGVMEIINVAFSVKTKGVREAETRHAEFIKHSQREAELRSLTDSLFVQWEQRRILGGSAQRATVGEACGSVIGTLAS